MPSHHFLLCAMLSIASLSASAGTSGDSIRRLVSIVNHFNQTFPQEKVYLHIDNTSYFMGETMWVKAYLTSSSPARTVRSGVAYIELLDPSGSVVKTMKLKVSNGTAYGEIKLDGLFRSGFYELRAYTRYMLNWGGDALFSRVIPIFDAPKEEGDYTHPTLHDDSDDDLIPTSRNQDKEKRGKTNMRFYPEGGHSVMGLPSTVAFTLTDRVGHPLQGICQMIVDGQVVDETSSDADGRGTLTYTPSGLRAQANVVLPDGDTYTFDMPKAESSGCALHVDMAKSDSIEVAIATSSDWMGRAIGMALLANGTIYRYETLTCGLSPARIQLAKDELREGVNQLSIIDTKGDILANRMLFAYPHATLQSVTAHASMEGRRMKLDMESAPNTNFSLAVRDADNQMGDWHQNMASYLLLASDLRGYIAHPDYYLESDDSIHARAADLLMMVQGWRRYDLRTMEGKDTFAVHHSMEKQMLLNGRVHPAKRKVSPDGIDLGLTISGNGQALTGRTVTRKDGHYTFTVPDCYGDRLNLYIRATVGDKPQDVRIGVNRHFSPQGRKLDWAERQPMERQHPSLLLSSLDGQPSHESFADSVRVLPQAVVTARRWQGKDYWQRESLGAGRSSIMYDCGRDADAILDAGGDIPSLVGYLKGKNTLVKGNDNVSGFFGHRNKSYDLLEDGVTYDRRPVLWVVDNHFVCATGVAHRYAKRSDEAEHVPEDGLYGIPTSLDEVRRVYIDLHSNRMNGWNDRVGNQAVTFYIYTYGDYARKATKGLRHTTFQAFHTPKTYDQEALPLDDWKNDHRRTLYWNPSVKADAKGQATVDVWLNATATGVIISAEGFTPDGKVLQLQLARKEETLHEDAQ